MENLEAAIFGRRKPIMNEERRVPLPKEIITGIRGILPLLQITQKDLARDARISQGSVSNFFSGVHLNRESGLKVIGTLGNYIDSRHEQGLLDDVKWRTAGEILTDAQSVYEPKTQTLEYSGFKRAGTYKGDLREMMVDSLAAILLRSAEIDRQVSEAMEDPGVNQDQLLAALRMGHLFNQVAQIIVKAHGNVIFPEQGKLAD